MSNSQFDYSITCAECGKELKGKAESPFAFMAGARVQGWEVPAATENRPIKCPDHQVRE